MSRRRRNRGRRVRGNTSSARSTRSSVATGLPFSKIYKNACRNENSKCLSFIPNLARRNIMKLDVKFVSKLQHKIIRECLMKSKPNFEKISICYNCETNLSEYFPNKEDESKVVLRSIKFVKQYENQTLKTIKVCPLIRSLTHTFSPNLTRLNIEYIDMNIIRENIPQILSKPLLKCKETLKHLSLMRCKMGDELFTSLVRPISQLKFLETINLSHNNLSAETLKCVLKLLKSKQENHTEMNWLLSLRNYTLTEKKEVAKKMNYSRGLSRIDLSGNFLQDPFLIDFCRLLPNDQTLKHVNFSSNLFTRSSLFELDRSLNNPLVRLDHIDVSNNPGVYENIIDLDSKTWNLDFEAKEMVFKRLKSNQQQNVSSSSGTSTYLQNQLNIDQYKKSIGFLVNLIRSGHDFFQDQNESSSKQEEEEEERTKRKKKKTKKKLGVSCEMENKTMFEISKYIISKQKTRRKRHVMVQKNDSREEEMNKIIIGLIDRVHHLEKKTVNTMTIIEDQDQEEEEVEILEEQDYLFEKQQQQLLQKKKQQQQQQKMMMMMEEEDDDNETREIKEEEVVSSDYEEEEGESEEEEEEGEYTDDGEENVVVMDEGDDDEEFEEEGGEEESEEDDNNDNFNHREMDGDQHTSSSRLDDDLQRNVRNEVEGFMSSL